MATEQSSHKASAIRNRLILAVGILLGAGAGYAYYYFIGCSSGTCPITSKPLNSSLYGALMGGLLAASFRNTNNNKTAS
jgi:phage shock protein E